MADQPPQPATLYHFTVATTRGPSQEDIAGLLRRVADALDDLGAVDVHDITFHVDWTDEGSWPSMTVYFELDDEAVETADEDEIALVEEVEPSPEAREVPREISLSENVFAVEVPKHTPFVGRGTRPRDDMLDLAEEEQTEEEFAEQLEPVQVELPTARTSERYGPVPNPVVPIVERVHVARSAPENNEPAATARPAPAQPMSSFPVRTPPGVDKPALQRLKDLLRTTNRRRA